MKKDPTVEEIRSILIRALELVTTYAPTGAVNAHATATGILLAARAAFEAASELDEKQASSSREEKKP
jgi:hypothetical protein